MKNQGEGGGMGERCYQLAWLSNYCRLGHCQLGDCGLLSARRGRGREGGRGAIKEEDVEGARGWL